MNKRILKVSPLTESSFYILLSLQNPLHGYGIIKKVERLTNNRLKLTAGTVYGAINTLLKNKLIELTDERNGIRGKKYYRATVLGKKRIYHEIDRLREMINNGINEIGDYYE